MKGLKKKKTTNKKRTDYKVDLNEIPGGDRRPIETCKKIEEMRAWRQRPLRADILYA